MKNLIEVTFNLVYPEKINNKIETTRKLTENHGKAEQLEIIQSKTNFLENNLRISEKK